MIYGIGIDIQEIAQISDIIERQGELFTSKIFTESEIGYCEKFLKTKYQHYAARWAAKEAFYKALGTGISNGYRFTDVEVAREPSGKPVLVMHGKVLQDVNRLHIKAQISISHSYNYAVAHVLAYYPLKENL